MIRNSVPCVIFLALFYGCSERDSPHARTDVPKQDAASVVANELVRVDGASGDQHPLVCGVGGDFPAGRELAFRHAESRELVHAVFPEGVEPPPSADGDFVLRGQFQEIQNMSRYTRKKPGPNYRYLVVSSWEHAAGE